METTSNAKKFGSWIIFIVLIGLVIWGLVAAQQKSQREAASLVLPSEVVATDHSRGSTIAPVTLVEYGDFQCPACGAYYPLVEQVVKEEGTDRLRFVFRHFPLSQHPNAVPAARASEAASIQGKFWEMYNLLYENQDSWATSTNPKPIFAEYAKQMGLDIAKFATDYDSQAVKDIIDNDYKGGAKGGVNSTPSYFVNGKQIVNPQSYDAFKKIIDDAATAAAK